jgi:hypothetical protein
MTKLNVLQALRNNFISGFLSVPELEMCTISKCNAYNNINIVHDNCIPFYESHDTLAYIGDNFILVSLFIPELGVPAFSKLMY